MAATLASDPSEIELKESTQDRWATPLAASIAAAHLLSGLVLVGWLYLLGARFKHEFNEFGVWLPAFATAIIRISDLVVDYWYVLIPLSPVASILDFFAARLIAEQIGLRVATAMGVCISLLFLANVAVFHYILSETKADILRMAYP
jgi:hypothetical protein